MASQFSSMRQAEYMLGLSVQWHAEDVRKISELLCTPASAEQKQALAYQQCSKRFHAKGIQEAQIYLASVKG